MVDAINGLQDAFTVEEIPSGVERIDGDDVTSGFAARECGEGSGEGSVETGNAGDSCGICGS